MDQLRGLHVCDTDDNPWNCEGTEWHDACTKSDDNSANGSTVIAVCGGQMYIDTRIYLSEALCPLCPLCPFLTKERSSFFVFSCTLKGE
jgi:hypothetical protein